MEESQLANSILSVLGGAAFFFCGLFMLKKPPKSINALYGYRTFRSMKNELLWKEGNRYAASLMMRLGAALAIGGFLLSLIVKGTASTIAIFAAILIAPIVLIARVERYLKQIDLENSKDK